MKNNNQTFFIRVLGFIILSPLTLGIISIALISLLTSLSFFFELPWLVTIIGESSLPQSSGNAWGLLVVSLILIIMAGYVLYRDYMHALTGDNRYDDDHMFK